MEGTDFQLIKHKAETAKFLYRTGKISKEEANQDIQPYLDLLNKKSKELAKKYGQRPKLVNFSSYVR